MIPSHRPLTRPGLAWRTLRYYWRSNAAVALGVAVAAGVLVGSLIVGDSVKGSLRDLALTRLGRTEHALTPRGFVREQIADDLLACPALQGAATWAAPGTVLEAAAQHAASQVAIPRVNVIAGGARLWAAIGGQGLEKLAGDRVFVNERLAQDLGAKAGDAILLNVSKTGAAPEQSVFGRRSRDDTVRTLRAVVAGVLTGQGACSFSPRSDEPRPRNVYVSLPWLQRRLDHLGQVNTVLVGRDGAGSEPTAVDLGLLDAALAAVLDLSDFGLRLAADREAGLLALQSDRLVLPDPVVQAAAAAGDDAGLPAQASSVYLANDLALLRQGQPRGRVPYSVVAALAPQGAPRLEPLRLTSGAAAPGLRPGDILLNTWTAEDLGAKVGDAIAMSYYVMAPRGALATATASFTVRGVVAMDGPGADPGLVPPFKGLTDAKSMADWDPPFPVDVRRVRPKDEAYWDAHRAGPKAFVAPAVAKRLWLAAGAGSAGDAWVTTVRVGTKGLADAQRAQDRFRSRLLARLPRGLYGLAFRPVRQEALAGAAGSTDFGMLFMSMSMFLVASAAGLVGLLLRLTIERRASQYGILLATGLSPKAGAGLLQREALWVAAAGVVLGAPLGVAYAHGIIYGLSVWWSGAVGEFSFSPHVRPGSVAAGMVAGWIVAVLAIRWGARLLRHSPTLALLSGAQAISAQSSPTAGLWAGAVSLGALGVGLALLAMALGGVVPTTPAFFGIGAALLVAALAGASWFLHRHAQRGQGRAVTLGRVAWRGLARNRARSLLTMGLLACASFLIVTVAANRKDLGRMDTRDRSSGSGGFNLLAKSALPIFHDLGTPAGRRALGFGREQAAALQGATVVPFRVNEGDDVSCLNLQRPRTPRVLGVPKELIERGGFRFAKMLAGPSPQERANPWLLLKRGPGPRHIPVIPAFAEGASAQWILRAGLGDVVEAPGRDGAPVHLRLVGFLAGSVFAGELLIAEEHFERYFGSDGGRRYFLIETDREQAATAALRSALGPMGLDVVRTADALAGYAAVQNTYLSTFETLGGLGLMLGTFGLVTVLVRSVVERRRELAMLRALGFHHGQVVAIIVLENSLLLVGGVLIGVVAALVAVTPHLLSVLASVQWLSLAGTLFACVVVGLVCCVVAARLALRGDLVPALRSE